MQKLITAALALVVLTAIALAPAGTAEWKLMPITGHNPNVWNPAKNWTYEAGNPMIDNGATWTLSVQKDKDPTLTSPYTPMEKATGWKYFFVWGAGGDEVPFMYRDYILSTKPGDNTPQAGPASVIRFRPAAEGTYQVDIVGTVQVQSPTAGHARATVYILGAGQLTATQLASVNLNNGTAGAFGSYPTALNFHAAVPLKKGEELAVRLQTINPGPASAGNSSLTFTTFTVSSAK